MRTISQSIQHKGGGGSMPTSTVGLGCTTAASPGRPRAYKLPQPPPESTCGSNITMHTMIAVLKQKGVPHKRD